MAIAATIDIVMRANTQDAIDKLWKTTGVLGKMKTAILGAASAWLSYISAARIAASISASFNRLDRLGELSTALDINPNALQAMGNAARTAGVDIETLAKAIFRMQRGIASAAGVEGNVFEQLGLSLATLKSLEPEQQFIAISRALNDVGDATKRAQLAQQIFGKGALDLLPLMSQVEETFKDSAELVGRFRKELTEVDMAKVGIAADAFDRLSQAIELAWDNLAFRFAPEIAALLGTLVRVVEIADQLMGLLARMWDLPEVRVLAFAAAVTALSLIIPVLTTAVVNLGRAFLALAGAQTVAQALSGPKGWAVIALAAGAAAVGYKMIEAELDRFNAQVAEIEERIANPPNIVRNANPRLEFQGDEGLGNNNIDKIADKLATITIRANPTPDELNSQEDWAKRMSVEIEVQADIHKAIRNNTAKANEHLDAIRAGIEAQNDNDTDGANF